MKDAQLREVLDFHKIPRHIRRALSDKRELSKEDKENIKELIKVNGTVSRKPISLKVQKESLTTEKDVPLIPNLRGKIKCERDYIKTIEGVE